MSQSILDTYSQARYLVQIKEDFLEFRVGQQLNQFDQILNSHQCTSAIFITAFNPQSEIFPLDINLKSNRMLLREIKSGGYQHLTGYGHDDENLWPKEPSFLVLGIERNAANSLAKRFNQNAYLWISLESPVELISLMT